MLDAGGASAGDAGDASAALVADAVSPLPQDAKINRLARQAKIIIRYSFFMHTPQ
jgi:hypothetical protein